MNVKLPIFKQLAPRLIKKEHENNHFNFIRIRFIKYILDIKFIGYSLHCNKVSYFLVGSNLAPLAYLFVRDL